MTELKRERGETRRHWRLKRLAAQWLREQGFALAVDEVRVPLSNYRSDVAGYAARGSYAEEPGDTVLIECKQSRADFLKDASVEAEAKSEQKRLVVEMEILTRLMGSHLPKCRRGLSLFAEYDEYDFGELRHERWRRLQARLAYLERCLREGSKFARMARYGCATQCWLAVEPGVLSAKSEVPAGWGCLVRLGEGFEVWVAAPRLASRPEVRLKLLERIAGRLARKRDQKAHAQEYPVDDEGHHADAIQQFQEKMNTEQGGDS